MSPAQLQALTPVTAPALARLNHVNTNAAVPKVGRSFSVTSIFSAGSTSSTYSRAAEDLLDRLAAQLPHSTFHLWSAGNVRLNGLNLTIPPSEADDLIRFIVQHGDERFEVVGIEYLDGEEGDDRKFAIRRTTYASPPTTPMFSDAE